MTKLDRSIKKEIVHMTIGLSVACALICLVYLIIGKFSAGVIVGCLIGCMITMIGFVWLGFSVQKAVNLGDSGKLYLQRTYYGRILLYGLWVVAAVKWPFVDSIASVIPVVLPTMIIKIMQALGISGSEDIQENNQEKIEGE